MGEALACQRLRNHRNGQEIWGKPEHANARRRHKTHLDGQGLWGKHHQANTLEPSQMDSSYGGSPIMPTPQNRPKWTGAIGEALARQRTPASQGPPRWTGAIGEAPSS